MKFKLFFCIPLLFLMTNCKTQKIKSIDSQNNTITIGLEKTVGIPGSKINIQFENIAEDSRCPADVTCIWEGIAVVNLKVKSGNETKNLQIATRDFAPKNAMKSIDYKGYIFTLQDVNPKPGGKKTESSVTIKYEKTEE